MEKDGALKLLRDKWFFFNQFLYGNKPMQPELREAFKESERLVEDAYLTGKTRVLKAASNDIDAHVRDFPLPLALDFKKQIKEQLGIDYDVVDKMRLKAIERLLKKGKISNPEDYELLLGRVEEIYADDNYNEEVERINKVLATYPE
ncbi:hypothetical protein [Chitinophaga defluvii]|uniref:Uncharacterized protein n=1 Tax=Chitinophaga defluvii TaxID=3163343 RepID=A0ABV2TAY6_9BACT